ncbi:MAG: hypothetical protein MUO77_11655 [Anaerolineales bacterium]|nr:hypothetical protein [Anaerolineales bacterium]
MPDQESERLKRLRERQLTDRDPLVKERSFQHVTSIKEKRMRKRFSLTKEWMAVPHAIKNLLYCLILGVIITVALPMILNSPYALYVGAGIAIVIIIAGTVTGYIMDYNDEIKHHLE